MRQAALLFANVLLFKLLLGTTLLGYASSLCAQRLTQLPPSPAAARPPPASTPSRSAAGLRTPTGPKLDPPQRQASGNPAQASEPARAPARPRERPPWLVMGPPGGGDGGTAAAAAAAVAARDTQSSTMSSMSSASALVAAPALPERDHRRVRSQSDIQPDGSAPGLRASTRCTLSVL